MATFIHTSRGLLNLDHVVLIKQGVGKEAGENYVQLADGRIIHGILIDPIPAPAVVSATSVGRNITLTGTGYDPDTGRATHDPTLEPAPVVSATPLSAADEEPKTAVGRWDS